MLGVAGDESSRAKGVGLLADWSKGQHAYQQLAEQLRERIRSGELAPDDQLPSYSELMREFSVSITVARAAVAELRAEGLVATHQGKGAFVLADAASRARPSTDDIESLRRDLTALADQLRTDLDEVRKRLTTVENELRSKR